VLLFCWIVLSHQMKKQGFKCPIRMAAGVQ
jgi:hypothetical protein